MNTEKIIETINSGEGIQVEFKLASHTLPKNVFESVCAMLNREGGHIFLGISNNGIIEGVFEDSVEKIKKDFISSLNDSKQLNPTYYLNIEEKIIDGKIILYAYIPESSLVHTYLGKTYDRNHEGDLNISGNPELIRQLHIKKQGSFSENIIYPYITINDLKADLIQRCRTLANNNKPGHNWIELDNEQMLRSANLWRKNYKTGDEGYTLAAALLFGKDELIHQILPHYKTDAILKIENIDRFDDREIVRTNLIESYDLLMAFISKHLPNKFHLEKDLSINLRDKIFREVISNTLIHREYSNEYPARLIIESNKIIIENWNRPHGSGKLSLDTYTPFPKNPVIASFFREIGRADELGSGFRNTSKYLKLYTNGSEPIFEEGDIFKIIIPIALKTDLTTDPTTDPTIDPTISGSKYQNIKSIIEEELSEITETNLSKLTTLLIQIIVNEGKRRPDYVELTKLGGDSTVKRFIDQLRSVDLIEYRGEAKHTGGYFKTKKLENIIINKKININTNGN